MHLLRIPFFLVLSTPAFAQWNPPTAHWGKVDPADVRVMTWNVQDAICSTNNKVEGTNNWCACARIVAALKPDVLFLAETADNSGNGTGTTVDTVPQLTTTIGNFLHGGNDSFHGNTPVTAYVQLYAPGYDLPYVYVSTDTDGFNRNVVLSRFPFADLNGDGHATIANIPTVSATAWAPGGDGGIRGFLFAEIDLPDSTYTGNLVLGGAHLKSGSAGSDHTQRITAAENVSYVVRYWWNGNGTSTPDPTGHIADSPPATNVLPANTPVVMVGDWNEDNANNGGVKSPSDWLWQAQTAGGTSDGTDADGTDATVDTSVNFFSGSRITHNSGSKLDYVVWQDSIATLRLSSVFYSGSNPAAAQPPELVTFAGGAAICSSTAADHRPVFADFRLPVVDCNGNGVADSTDIANGTSTDSNGNGIPDECECTATNYCQTSPNSVGPGAIMDSAGLLSIAANNFHLLASGCPPNTSSIFFYGQTETQVAFGNGFRCVGGSVIRLPIVQVDGLGTAIYHLDFNTLPAGGMITAGSTWRFQLWYRNPAGGGAGFNLSDARRVRFCP